MADNMIPFLVEVDEVSFDDFYEKVESSIEDGAPPVAAPETRIKARDWLLAVLKIEHEIEILEGEYIPALIERYITPVKDKISKYEKAREIIRLGLRQFLENADEKNVCFPDLATVSRYDPDATLIYPDDEKAMIKLLDEANSIYIKKEPKLDKKKIREDFKKNGTPPIDGLIAVDAVPSVRITKTKKKDANGG